MLLISGLFLFCYYLVTFKININSGGNSKRPPPKEVAFSKSKESERHSLYNQYDKEEIGHHQRRWFPFDNETV